MSNRFQSLDFKDIDDLFNHLPDQELQILRALRELVLEQLPEVQEKLKYNVPFYTVKKNICYLWPASVPWGGKIQGVQIGFTRGHLLDHDAYLQSGKRKYVRSKDLIRLTEEDYEILSDLLQQAYKIDRQS